MKLPSSRPEDLLPEYEFAYDELPEPYKCDSALMFYVFDGRLYAKHDLHGTYVWSAEACDWTFSNGEYYE